MLIFVAFAIRTSWFQTWAAQQVASYLSGEWGTDVSIEKVDIIFFDRVDIEGVYVADKLNDTLLYSKLIHADIADWSLRKSFVDIARVELADTYCYIKKYKGDTTLNFQHIVDYFASDEKDTSSSPFKVGIQTIALNNINFTYADYNAPPLKHGMDFSNLVFKNLSGEFSDFGLNGDSISVNISHLRLKEQSGLVLSEFSSKVLYCPEVVSLQNLRLGFNNSYLISDYFQLLTPNGSEAFTNFVSDVRFNANIRDSRISLADVALFVPSIWGMDDYVTIDNIDISGPVYGMKLKNTEIRLLDTTLIAGDFQIPDLSDINSAFFEEKITIFRTSVDDIEKLNLSPFLKDGMKHFELENNLHAANIIKLENGSFIGGLESFVVDGDIYTGLGEIHSQYGIQFNKKEDGLYYYDGPDNLPKGRDVEVADVNLRAISGNSNLGSISGYFDIDGHGFSKNDLDVNFKGELYSIGLNGYNYTGINVRKGNFANDVFTGVIDVEDDHLALNYDGKVDLKGDMFFDFAVRIDSAILNKLNLTTDSIANRFESLITVKVRGTSIDELTGDVSISKLLFQDNSVHKVDFKLDTLSLSIRRSKDVDTISLFSPYVDIDLTGKFDLTDIYPVLQTQLSYVLSNLISPQEIGKTKNKYFDLTINLKDVNPLLQFFDDQIYISENARINSYYNIKEKRFAFDFNIEKALYHGMSFDEIKVENHFDSIKATLDYQIQYAKINDSLHVRNIYVDSYIKKNAFLTNLGWDGHKGTEPALFAFKTTVDDEKNVLTDFEPSFFFLKSHKWEIDPNSMLLWTPELIQISKFKIANGNHKIKFDGKISKNPKDWLYFYVEDFDLADLNGILGGEMKLGGILNVDGGVADLYDNIRFQSISDIKNFELNDELVGDLMIGNQWDKTTNSLNVLGNLKRDRSETFRFEGKYFLEKEKDNIELELFFDYTDISFLNAFEDPELYTDIEGILNGSLKVNGELTNPVVTGDLDIIMAGVMVPMFNVGFGFSGGVDFGDGEIIVQNMNLFDQEGNQGKAAMQIYHEDWGNWNYDVTLDLEDPQLSKSFLVMNTKYEEGSYYYGKAYVSGFVNIFGYDDLVQITVDAKTQKGTDLTLPMYGSSELEETSFIIFTSPNDTSQGPLVKEIERLGMTLDMKFNVTKDAKVSIVFEPIYGDQIVVNEGQGDIEINLDNYGVLSMFGKYEILNGEYNMRIKTFVKEDFKIVPGSALSWNGSPYDADIDIRAEFERNLSLADIMPNEASDRGNKKDQVLGILVMSKTLMAPALAFEIKAPKADQEGKDALAQLETDSDLLMKQFFSILVLKRFLPTQGGTGGGNAVLGLAESQINQVLGSVSENVQLAADLNEGEKKIGASTQVSEKVTITVSGGVVDDGTSASNIVEDVEVEYQLNEDGSFTMNFFNSSNTGADAEQGPFTQGVSMHYQENFDDVREFRLLQGFLNIFRPESKDIEIKKEGKTNKRKTPIPKD